MLERPLHPCFEAAANAASAAFRKACRGFDREGLEEVVAMGADGTPTMRIDALVEEAIAEAITSMGVNMLSEEIGFVDNGSALTLVVDPLDGSANAAAGVPLACFSAALHDGERFVEAMTEWLETGRRWAARRGEPSHLRTTGRAFLDGAAVSMLRPHPRNREAWMAVADRAARVRILSCSTLEIALVMQGSTDAFADAGSDTHRLVDLAAALVLVPSAGGAVMDVHGRPIDFDINQTRRWSGVAAASARLAEELCECIAMHVEGPRPQSPRPLADAR